MKAHIPLVLTIGCWFHLTIRNSQEYVGQRWKAELIHSELNVLGWKAVELPDTGLMDLLIAPCTTGIFSILLTLCWESWQPSYSHLRMCCCDILVQTDSVAAIATCCL